MNADRNAVAPVNLAMRIRSDESVDPDASPRPSSTRSISGDKAPVTVAAPAST